MNHVLTHNNWEFGGPLAGLPPHLAWSWLAGAMALGLVLAWLSYQFTVRPLTRGRRAVLVGLRALFFFALLFCLANPARVESTTVQPTAERRRLAVVVDRSDSMTTADNRGHSRLTDALRNWRRLEPSAKEAFAETHYYSLAKDLRPAATLDEAATRTGNTEETWMYQSLQQLLALPPNERPDSVVVLTDGLDTTPETADRLVTRALTEQVSLYFISGSNRLQPQPFIRVRELRAPATALRNSEFVLNGTIEAFSKEAQTVPYTLWHGSERIASGNFSLNPGHNVLPWENRIKASEPGELELALRLDSSPNAPIAARTSTQIVAHQKIRVLFYQGALDWGFRYLIDALQTDPSFELTSLINPALHVTLTRGIGASDAPNQLPDTVAGLKDYDFVILAHPYPTQISLEQQQALLDFVRQGGGVLFTSPDAAALPQFTGQPLAELLPVEFNASAGSEMAHHLAELQSSVLNRAISFSEDGSSQTSTPLKPFTITQTALALPVFAQTGKEAKTPLVPRFLDYAPASHARPGAEILAVHPSDKDPASHDPYILLAAQFFGRGRAAILTTDGLWHWKLNEPSESHVVETFWQQLLLWLGQGHTQGPRFVDAPAQVAVGEQLPLLLAGVSSAKPPVVTATGPDGVTKTLAVQPSGEPDAPWTFNWVAATAGAWELRANGDGDMHTRIFPYVIAQTRGELAQTAPALDQMRAIADATRGDLLDETTPANWEAPEPSPPTTVNEQHTLLWDRWPVIGLAFTLFTLELCLRRRWKLL